MTYFTELKYFKNLYGTTKDPKQQQQYLEKEEQIWKNHATYNQTILQGHSDQNSMALA